MLPDSRVIGKMRVCFIGNVASSLYSLEVLAGFQELCLAGVVTRETASNADHVDLGPFCEERGIAWTYSGPRIEGKSLAFLRDAGPDAIFCIGWSSLLSKEVLNIAPLGTVGFHPAPLPLGRGRHPLIWALVLGLRQTASTFFFMDEGADSGDIISQMPVSISKTDTAATLYKKIMHVAKEQLLTFVPAMASGKLCRFPQDHSKASSWRKRGASDGAIDFRMSAEAVFNLVRALSSPYPGAHVMHKSLELKIWSAKMALCDNPYHEPGKILAVNGDEVTIKCGVDAIVLVSKELACLSVPGDYVL